MTRLTPHAQERMRVMGVEYAEVANALRDPEFSYPGGRGHAPGRMVFVRRRLAVVVDERQGVVVTVLWNRHEGRDDNGKPIRPEEVNR